MDTHYVVLDPEMYCFMKVIEDPLSFGGIACILWYLILVVVFIVIIGAIFKTD